MATYTGEVIETDDDDFPFMAIVSDETGTVVGETPVRTQTDGEAKLVEMLQSLAEIAKESDASAS